MDKQKLSLLIEKKILELESIEKKLENLLLLSDKIIHNATGLQIIDYINRHPELPRLLLKNINLKEIEYKRIKESTAVPSQLFLSRLREFIDVYAGSKRYLKERIEELSSFLF
ncbi:MAG: hypothetical protein ACFFAO_11770 [Candidatus Hermodarchaeota archaeon]